MPVRGDPHKIFRPKQHYSDTNELSYLSKGFLIRYCEEEVEINECVLFRDEITLDENLDKTDVYLEIELFFSDMANNGGPTTCMKANANKDFESKAEFKSVQKQTLKLRQPVRGMCEFVPVKFTNYYNCVLNLQIQATMLDLKFRANQEVQSIASALFTD